MEIDYEKLKETGINIADRDLSKADPQKMFCPDCHKDRKNHPKDKPLAVYWNSCYAKCFNCGHEFFFGKTEKIGHQPTKRQSMKKETKEYKKPTKLANETAPDEKVLAWFASRGIPAEVVTQEGITQAARSFPQTNQVEKCIVFPYTVERDRNQGVTRVHVQKVKFRHLGYPGVASFKYNTHNGRFVSIEEGKTPDIPDIIPDYDNSNWLGKKLPKQGELGL